LHQIIPEYSEISDLIKKQIEGFDFATETRTEGTIISVSEKEAFRATDLMNNRPRKCLEYKTPFEVFAELTGKDSWAWNW
jgi:F0F1-type ATP synthase alpha subunit